MAFSKFDKLVQEYEKHCLQIIKATEVGIPETPREKADRIRRLEASYVGWFEYYFPMYSKKKCAAFHQKAANTIIRNRHIRFLAEWFRSAAKSVHLGMGVPLFLYLVEHDLKFMLQVGETEPKAKKLLSGIQAQLQYNKRLINDYGEKFQMGDWADGDFTTVDGVKFMALGFGQSPRGVREAADRPDYINVDDVDNKRHVNNDRMMREAIDFITEDVWGCFDSDDDATDRFVYANNNFHANSITNRLKLYFQQASAALKAEGNASNFVVHTVKAVKDLSSFLPSWPEKTTVDYWRKKFNSMPYRSFMREFMHVHIQDGAIFQYDDIIYGDVLHLSKYESLCFYGDLSYKAAGDYKAMILIGKVGREFHIIHSYLRQGSRAKVAEWLYNIYEDKKLERFSIQYYIEGLFAQDEFVNDFDLEGDKRGYYIPVVADKRGKADKYDRIESLSGHFERRNVIFNRAEQNAPDQAKLVDQFLAFEKGSNANDDGPDAVHGGFSKVNKSTYQEKFPVTTVSRDEIRSRSRNSF